MLSKFEQDSDGTSSKKRSEVARREAARASREDDALQDLLGVLPKTAVERNITRADGLKMLLEFLKQNTPNSDKICDSDNNYRIRRCVKVNGHARYVWVGTGDPAKNPQWASKIEPSCEKTYRKKAIKMEPYETIITVHPLDEEEKERKTEEEQGPEPQQQPLVLAPEQPDYPLFEVPDVPVVDPIYYNNMFNSRVGGLDVEHGEGPSTVTTQADIAWQNYQRLAYHPFLQCPLFVSGFSTKPCDWCYDNYPPIGPSLF